MPIAPAESQDDLNAEKRAVDGVWDAGLKIAAFIAVGVLALGVWRSLGFGWIVLFIVLVAAATLAITGMFADDARAPFNMRRQERQARYQQDLAAHHQERDRSARDWQARLQARAPDAPRARATIFRQELERFEKTRMELAKQRGEVAEAIKQRALDEDPLRGTLAWVENALRERDANIATLQAALGYYDARHWLFCFDASCRVTADRAADLSTLARYEADRAEKAAALQSASDAVSEPYRVFARSVWEEARSHINEARHESLHKEAKDLAKRVTGSADTLTRPPETRPASSDAGLDASASVSSAELTSIEAEAAMGRLVEELAQLASELAKSRPA